MGRGAVVTPGKSDGFGDSAKVTFVTGARHNCGRCAQFRWVDCLREGERLLALDEMAGSGEQRRFGGNVPPLQTLLHRRPKRGQSMSGLFGIRVTRHPHCGLTRQASCEVVLGHKVEAIFRLQRVVLSGRRRAGS